MVKIHTMKKDFKNLIELIEFFSTEAECIKYLKSTIWKDGAFCPHCGSNEIMEYTDIKRNRCKSCKCDFSIRKGTIFEDSNVKLKKWFMATYLFNAHKKGISSPQLAKDIGVSQPTAWFMLQRLRHASNGMFKNQFQGTCEIDETYIGGKYENMHTSKKATLPQKATVLAIINRDTKQVKAYHTEDNKYHTLGEKVFQKVEHGSTWITDEYKGYKALKYYYNHQSINHSAKEYVRNGKTMEAIIITTNTVEDFFGLLKRGINGIYRWCSKKHLNRYLGEYSLRYNSREITDCERFTMFLGNIQGKMSYKELIA
ncbi:MAG: transposase-like protein [Candidatus Deianiraeaceae bacterium]|jgi:transposase-like protein